MKDCHDGRHGAGHTEIEAAPGRWSALDAIACSLELTARTCGLMAEDGDSAARMKSLEYALESYARALRDFWQAEAAGAATA